MKYVHSLPILLLTVILSVCNSNDNKIIVDWQMDNLVEADDQKVVILDQPKVVDSEIEKAVKFDGIDDGLILNFNPLNGLNKFTVEAVIKPYSGGETEQRFLHFGTVTGDRVLFETRLTNGDQWYFDGYAKSGNSEQALLDSTKLHPVDQWFHTALVFDNGDMKTFVNGKLELTGNIDFEPFGKGRTSIGVRMNEVYWYKGEIYSIKVTSEILSPDQFIDIKTNR